MRKLLCTAVWKPLTPFPLNPGFERVTRVTVKPENTEKFLMMSEKLQAEINAAGEEFEMGVLIALGGGVNENNLMLRNCSRWKILRQNSTKKATVEKLHGDLHFKQCNL